MYGVNLYFTFGSSLNMDLGFLYRIGCFLVAIEKLIAYVNVIVIVKDLIAMDIMKKIQKQNCKKGQEIIIIEHLPINQMFCYCIFNWFVKLKLKFIIRYCFFDLKGY